MLLLRPLWLAGLFSLSATGLLAQEAPMAQTAPQDTGSAAQMGQRPSEAKLVFPVLVFDRARVVKQSQAGAALEARMAEAREALLAENDQIYADLEAEEQEISDAKSTMAEAEFRARAQAFDEKVTQVRQRQDEKARDIQTLYDEGLAEIDQQMNTVLTQIARDLGAVVVFERNQVYLMNGAIDISRIAIEKLDDREGAQAREQGSETASPTDAEQQETPPAQD